MPGTLQAGPLLPLPLLLPRKGAWKHQPHSHSLPRRQTARHQG